MWSWVSLWRWSAYGFYAILIFVVCVYITFPSSRFHAWLIAEADRRFGVQIEAQALQSYTPFHFDIDTVTLSLEPGLIPSLGVEGARVMPIEHLGLKFYAWPLLLGQYVLDMDINAFDGAIHGTLTAEKSGSQWRYHVVGNGENLDLDSLEKDILISRADEQIVTAGTGAIHFDLTWIGGDIHSGSGMLSISIEDTVISLAGFSPVTLSELTASLLRDKQGWWRTDDLKITGQDNGIVAVGQARVLLDESLSNSMVNLSANVTIDDVVKRQYPQLGAFMPNTGEPVRLTVTGTLSRPTILINGVPILVS